MEQLLRIENNAFESPQVDSAIEVRDLFVHYGNVLAVKGISFSVSPGEHMTLLGPSGCGKTTTLRCLAGLETPTSGEIRIGGEIVYSSHLGINRPAEKRNLSMMFQNYAIWPHMTIFENVAYGLRLRRYKRHDIEERVHEALEMVNMSEYAKREASQLSGGQQQRVALARSIAFYPKALLMDEPLSNLDARLRVQMRNVIKRLQKRLGMTTVYVTHDQEEALALSDHIVVMRDGSIEQKGRPLEIYNTPRTAFVADFVGAANIIKGYLHTKDGKPELEVGDGIFFKCCPPADLIKNSSHEQCSVSVRAVYPKIFKEKGNRNNTFPATIKRRVFLGDSITYTVTWGSGDLEIRTLPDELFEEQDEVYVHIDPAHLNFLNIEGDTIGE